MTSYFDRWPSTWLQWAVICKCSNDDGQMVIARKQAYSPFLKECVRMFDI